MFRKKIAALLVVLMIGSWCLYAAETDEAKSKADDEAAGIILISIGIAVAVGLTIWGIVALVGGKDKGDKFKEGYFGELPDDSQPVSVSSSDSVVPAPDRIPKIGAGNPILDHAMFGASGEKVFVGARFSF
ncbi:MAG: hypothetical protein LBD48_08070 [Treponema sp.]|jgi:hypothetical protein|nr:hypothetical protein [Treponema sp.]